MSPQLGNSTSNQAIWGADKKLFSPLPQPIQLKANRIAMEEGAKASELHSALCISSLIAIYLLTANCKIFITDVGGKLRAVSWKSGSQREAKELPVKGREGVGGPFFSFLVLFFPSSLVTI